MAHSFPGPGAHTSCSLGYSMGPSSRQGVCSTASQARHHMHWSQGTAVYTPEGGEKQSCTLALLPAPTPGSRADQTAAVSQWSTTASSGLRSRGIICLPQKRQPKWGSSRDPLPKPMAPGKKDLPYMGKPGSPCGSFWLSESPELPKSTGRLEVTHCLPSVNSVP